MLSRIFQISESPVKQDDYISISDFIDHWFIGYAAEFVSDDNDRDEDIRDFCGGLKKTATARFNKKDSAVSFKVLPGGKESYFTEKYESFVVARDKTMGMNLPEFASGHKFAEQMRIMCNAFCLDFDAYVWTDDYGIIPLDEFIRDAEIGTRYYIGGVLDYHC